MLHRYSPDGLICITQPHHAWISGQLARAWGNEDFSDFIPKEEVCLGAEIHDIGWLLWEKAPTLNQNTGYPDKFLELPVQVHIGMWSNAKYLALSMGKYAALLVSMHGTGLYERFRHWEKSPESTQIVQEFLRHEYAFQKQLIETLQNDAYYAQYATTEVIKRNQKLVATWDALSLILCHGQEGEQVIENVPTVLGSETTLKLTLIPGNPQEIIILPWPFQSSQVTLVYEGRLVREKFTDETVMQAALSSASWVTLTTILKPSG